MNSGLFRTNFPGIAEIFVRPFLNQKHPADISKALQGLVARGLLEKALSGRWTTYVLSARISRRLENSPHKDGDSPHYGLNSPHKDGNSPHYGPNSPHKDGDSPHNEGDFPHKAGDFPHNARNFPHNEGNSPHNEVDYPHNEGNYPHNKGNFPHYRVNSPHKIAAFPGTEEFEDGPDEWERLAEQAEPVRSRDRCSPVLIRQTVLLLCSGRFLTKRNLGTLLGRDAKNLQERFLNPLVEKQVLELRFPSEPNRPDQAYRTRAGHRRGTE